MITSFHICSQGYIVLVYSKDDFLKQTIKEKKFVSNRGKKFVSNKEKKFVSNKEKSAEILFNTSPTLRQCMLYNLLSGEK